MTRAQALVTEIRAYCAAHADPSKADRWKRYFTEGYDAWGLLDKNDPFFNEQQEAWLAAYATLGAAGFLKAGELLFASGKYEEGAIAIRFLTRFRDQLDRKLFPRLGRWFEAGIGNWAHTDVLCGEIIAPLLASRRIELADLVSWRGSQLKYQRRAVPVAMLGLLKNDFAAPPLLDFVRPLMLDAERVVQQGVGWFLRETWKKDPRPVESFLLEWKEQAPRLIYQYATEKMTPAMRQRYRRRGAGFSAAL